MGEWRSCCALLALVAAVSCGGAPKPHVLLITIDTLRADALGAYGAPPGASPRLDRLAREGVLFENAATPMPITRPAHFALFSSRGPRLLGAMSNAATLPDGVATLAEALRDVGYQTAAFPAAKLLNEESGIARGFVHFEAPVVDQAIPAERALEQVIDWLDAGQEGPWLIWVHLFDPHQPYAPPPRYVPRVDPVRMEQTPSIAWAELFAAAALHEGDVPAALLEHARALYAGEVRRVDTVIGRLLDEVEARVEERNLLVAITADHGECFENGRYFEHADCLFDGATRIPMILRYPSDLSGGRRESRPVGLTDLAPGILDLAGIPTPSSFLGRSLFDPEREHEAFVRIELPHYGPREALFRLRQFARLRSVAGDPTRRPATRDFPIGLRGSRWKYWQTQSSTVLYDLEGDPVESSNVAADHPEVVRNLRRRVEQFAKAHPVSEPSAPAVSRELEETLRALGYLE